MLRHTKNTRSIRLIYSATRVTSNSTGVIYKCFHVSLLLFPIWNLNICSLFLSFFPSIYRSNFPLYSSQQHANTQSANYANKQRCLWNEWEWIHTVRLSIYRVQPIFPHNVVCWFAQPKPIMHTQSFYNLWIKICAELWIWNVYCSFPLHCLPTMFVSDDIINMFLFVDTYSVHLSNPKGNNQLDSVHQRYVCNCAKQSKWHKWIENDASQMIHFKEIFYKRRHMFSNNFLLRI